MADVVIVGGGVMGASCAYWLTRLSPGLAVTVVERDTSYTHAATALSVASVRQQFSTDVNVKISRFGIDFIRHFEDRLGHSVGVPSLGLRENGYLFVTGSVENAALMRDVAAMQCSHGAVTDVLDAAGIAARFPWLHTDDLVAGSFGARDEGWFDNMGLLAGFKAAAVAQGARFVRDEVTGISVVGGRVTGVHLGQGGDLPCGVVVNAAGTRGADVAAMVGFALVVEPRKRTVFVIDAPNARHPEAPLMIDAGYYLRPEDKHWIVATVPSDDGPCDINDFDPDLHLFEDVIWEQFVSSCTGL